MFGEIDSILKQALIADIETTSLTRGAGVHQLATYNMGSGHLNQWFVDPNLTLVEPRIKGQDITNLATSARDIHKSSPLLTAVAKAHGNVTWHDVFLAQTLIDKTGRERLLERLKTRGAKPTSWDIQGIARIPGVWDDVKATLAVTDPFQYDAIVSGKFHYLSNNNPQSEKELRTLLRSKGSPVKTVKNINSAIEDVLLRGDGALVQHLKKGAIWIANADFEAKQLGARLAVHEQAILDDVNSQNLSKIERARKLLAESELRKVIQGTSATTSDLFHVTGTAVNRARAEARRTGDWRGVYTAIMQNTGAGDVRDIIDVVRSQQSFGQKPGLLSGTQPFSLGMDIQARLFGFSEAATPEMAKSALLRAESHIAAHDVAVTEELVLRKSMAQTEALRQWSHGTENQRKILERAASQKRGPLFEALRYFEALEHLSPQLQEVSLKQRLGRMFQDFAAEGASSQVVGYKPISREQITPTGQLQKIPGATPVRQTYRSIDDAAKFILSQSQYGAVKGDEVYRSVLEKFADDGLIEYNRTNAGGGGVRIKSAERLATSAKMLSETAQRQVQSIIEREAPSLMHMEAPRVPKGLHIENRRGLRATARDNKLLARANTKMFGMFALGMAGINVFDAIRNDVKKPGGPESLRTINYQQWLEMQSTMYGIDPGNPGGLNKPRIDGLQKSGLGALMRQVGTDFGSPYQGPQISNSVFTQTNLLEERERYMQNAFARTHMSTEGEVGRMLRAWVTLPISHAQELLNRQPGRAYATRSHSQNYSYIQESFDTVQGSQYAGLKPANFLKLNLAEGGWKVTATDADTIAISRKKASGGWFDFFGSTESYSVRIAGIDAPETTKGAKQGQPWANAATAAAQQMIQNARNLEILIDPSNITYGRMVGSVFADNKNVGLELVRQGMAQFLPYKGKGTKQMYEASSFQAAENMAINANRGIWNTPYFQPYGDWKKQTGESVTFNQMVNSSKVAQNSKFMSLRSVMEHSHQLGFYGAAQAAEISEISKSPNSIMGSDYDNKWRELNTFSKASAPHNNYLSQMKTELAGLIKTKGSRVHEKLKTRNIHTLDKTLVLDSMRTTTNAFSKRKISTFDMYNANHINNLRGRDSMRKTQMAEVQRNLNKIMFTHPVNHHMM